MCCSRSVFCLCKHAGQKRGKGDLIKGLKSHTVVCVSRGTRLREWRGKLLFLISSSQATSRYNMVVITLAADEPLVEVNFLLHILDVLDRHSTSDQFRASYHCRGQRRERRRTGTRRKNSCLCIHARSSRTPSSHDIIAGPGQVHTLRQHTEHINTDTVGLVRAPCTVSSSVPIPLRDNQGIPAAARATTSMVKPRDDPTLQHALSLFQDAFGSEPDIAAFAPGRVNLIGAFMRSREREENERWKRGKGGKENVVENQFSCHPVRSKPHLPLSPSLPPILPP